MQPVQKVSLEPCKRGSMTSGSTSFGSLDGIGSNIHVVGLADLTSLYNSSSPIVENEQDCSRNSLRNAV